jgi:hypothetical protein
MSLFEELSAQIAAQMAARVGRPEVKDLKRSLLQILLHVVTAALVIAYWCSAIYAYQKRTPGEYDPILFSTIASMVYFFLMIPELVPPRDHNYLVKITEENARTLYSMTRTFIGCFRLVMVALFFPIILSGWSFEASINLGLVAIVAITLYYMYCAKRAA